MGLIVERIGSIQTVAELIRALQAFPADMPIEVDGEGEAAVYRVKPQRGEHVYDKRGRICVVSDDE